MMMVSPFLPAFVLDTNSMATERATNAKIVKNFIFARRFSLLISDHCFSSSVQVDSASDFTSPLLYTVRDEINQVIGTTFAG